MPCHRHSRRALLQEQARLCLLSLLPAAQGVPGSGRHPLLRSTGAAARSMRRRVTHRPLASA
ncbi:hypothetical protein ABIE27_006116 [Paenibacillus sp. 4624]|uniref:Uncharacterized protein n=1 Tax=Paenibacillus amylolyticus TaxID=1451 RepID=A0A5M9X0P6_PAEAM|nr:hypothetical protein [Paenibacillus amylolyticus]KAA8787510.1 hypothetical protein EC604_27125 [Paenibacillus amylolyticus]